jgi:putative transposase
VLWAADMAQIRTGEGWLYLAAVLDLWSRRVVGWAMGSAVNAELVSDALLMAFQRRRPDQRVVHHSDRGAAYNSLALCTRLAVLELDQSFSAVGICYDNAEHLRPRGSRSLSRPPRSGSARDRQAPTSS